MSHRAVSANEFVQRWAEALNVDANEVARLVIDAEAGRVLRVYVQKFGSKALLDVTPPGAHEMSVTVLP